MSPIPFGPPPHLPDVVSTWTLSSFEGLGHMRSSLSEVVSATDGARPRRGRATLRNLLLASSELATNALKHTQSSARVVLSTDGETFLLDVVDRAKDTVPQRAAGRGPGEGGFGLVLVARVSTVCGWYVSRDEKHIWATFPARDEVEVPRGPVTVPLGPLRLPGAAAATALVAVAATAVAATAVVPSTVVRTAAAVAAAAPLVVATVTAPRGPDALRTDGV